MTASAWFIGALAVDDRFIATAGSAEGPGSRAPPNIALHAISSHDLARQHLRSSTSRDQDGRTGEIDHHHLSSLVKSKTAAPILIGKCIRSLLTTGGWRMRMGEIEIHDYARQLLDAHGEMAVVEAAQKARTFEEKGQTEEAETWRAIEAALKLMRGPHVS
jgi:hypothetical protein